MNKFAIAILALSASSLTMAHGDKSDNHSHLAYDGHVSAGISLSNESTYRGIKQTDNTDLKGISGFLETRGALAKSNVDVYVGVKANTNKFHNTGIPGFATLMDFGLNNSATGAEVVGYAGMVLPLADSLNVDMYLNHHYFAQDTVDSYTDAGVALELFNSVRVGVEHTLDNKLVDQAQLFRGETYAFVGFDTPIAGDLSLTGELGNSWYDNSNASQNYTIGMRYDFTRTLSADVNFVSNKFEGDVAIVDFLDAVEGDRVTFGVNFNF